MLTSNNATATKSSTTKAPKAPAKAPAAVASPAPATAGRGVPLQAITLLVPQCPKRPGTTCHKRASVYWAAYAAPGATTATAMAAGATAADLKWDAAHGFIKLNPM